MPHNPILPNAGGNRCVCMSMTSVEASTSCTSGRICSGFSRRAEGEPVLRFGDLTEVAAMLASPQAGELCFFLLARLLQDKNHDDVRQAAAMQGIKGKESQNERKYK